MNSMWHHNISLRHHKTVFMTSQPHYSWHHPTSPFWTVFLDCSASWDNDFFSILYREGENWKEQSLSHLKTRARVSLAVLAVQWLRLCFLIPGWGSSTCSQKGGGKKKKQDSNSTQTFRKQRRREHFPTHFKHYCGPENQRKVYMQKKENQTSIPQEHRCSQPFTKSDHTINAKNNVSDQVQFFLRTSGLFNIKN